MGRFTPPSDPQVLSDILDRLPDQVQTALPGLGAEAMAVRIVPTGQVPAEQCVGVVLPTDVNSPVRLKFDMIQVDPTPGGDGLPVRIMPEGTAYDHLSTLARTVGPNPTTGSQSVLLATDHPDILVQITSPVADTDPATNASAVVARLVPSGTFYDKLAAIASTIGSQPASNALTFRFPNNVFPITGKNTSSLTGGGQVVEINTGPTQLFMLRMTFEGAGQPFWLQIHDAATATALSTATFTGLTYPLDQLNMRSQVTFGGITPITLSAGCKVGISSTEKTYTAVDQQFFVAYSYRVPI